MVHIQAWGRSSDACGKPNPTVCCLPLTLECGLIGIPNRYRIIKVTGGREIIDQPEEISSMSPATMLKGKSRILGAFIIECFYIDYDGQQFGPVKVTFQIPKFEGTRDIQSLSLMPLDCDAEKSQTYQRLLDRGKRFTELAMSKTPAHKRYEGLSLGRTQKQVNFKRNI